MKNVGLIFIVLLLTLNAKAQTVFYDASAFPLLGKISDATETRYERLPAKLKDVSRPAVWHLGKNTAGLAIRFCSNSQQISLRWEVLNDFSMNHMAPTGIKGLDLYCLENGVWTYVNTARPTEKKSEATVIANMEKKERELMLYLPLYDGVVSLEIGVDSTAFIEQPKVDLPRRTKPMVAYGTSILQGGCASRPGMAHTNILSRKFNREIINLGFSGNGQLDYEIAELMSECDASLFILDFVPNASVEQIHEKTEKFYRILRDKHPDVPIVFVEDPVFPHSKYNLIVQNEVQKKNEALHIVFENLKTKKEKNIWLISSAEMIGTDGEATVDGVHFTDLGFLRYAEYLYPKIQKIIPIPVAEKEKEIWIDADANLRRFLVKENVGKYLDTIAATGFTKIILDVRPGSAYPMYPSKVLPELTKVKGFEFHRDWDYLQYFLDEAHRRNLKVTASITAFSGGRQPFGEGVVYDDPKWNGKSSVEYLPDRGMIDIRDNLSQHHVFMNPLDSDWKNLTLDLLREIVTNYPVDGVALDYCRYANGGNADFSEMSRAAFETYLGKKLERFPDDIFKYDENGKRVPGIYFKDWWAFRAKNIHDFIRQARDTIKTINPDIQLEYWAASWYGALHASGQNWASKNHNTSKDHPDFANEDYSKYGFADLLDIFQSGAYLEIIWGLDEPESIESQLANSMRVVRGDCKLYGSVYAANQKTAKDISDAVYICLKNTDGLSIFDLLQVAQFNLWDGIKDGIRRASETTLLAEKTTERPPIVDMALIYGGSAHRDVVWNKDHFLPYVSYTDRTNKSHWLFDGFLLLEIVDGKGKIFATGYNGTPATKNEWKALADYFFTPGQSVDALNQCIAEKTQTLGAPPQKRKLIIALPEPIVAGPDSHYKNTPADYWGDVNGSILDFTVQDDRIAACRWYIDYVSAKFNEGKFSHLELEGFYWIAEETLHTKSILAAVSDYLEDKGYTFNWIPYWKEKPDYLDWKTLGFHSTYLQPNYFFNLQTPYSRLDEVCKLVKEYDLDLELEFDMRVFVDNGDRGARLYDYMNAFRQNGVLENERIAYYQDCDAIYQLYHSSDKRNQAIFHDFCEFVLEHQSVYTKNKNN